MPIYRLLDYIYKSPIWIRIVVAIGWYAFIWQLTELPQATANNTKEVIVEAGAPPFMNWVFRVSSHLFVFGIESLLIYSIIQPKLNYNRRSFALALLIILFLGIGDEVHQSFVPGRFPNWEDVSKDVIGATLFLCTLFYLRTKLVSVIQEKEKAT